MQVLLFANLAEACGARAVEVVIALPAHAEEVRIAAERQHPGLCGHRYRIAVNARYVAEGDAVTAGAEVAFLPPVSGG
jgi:molybdopterin converting factor small subunit